MAHTDHEAPVFSGLALTDLITAQAPLSIADLRAAIVKLERIRAAGPNLMEAFLSAVDDAVREQRGREWELTGKELEVIQELATTLSRVFGIELGRAQLAVKEHFYGSRRKAVEPLLEHYSQEAAKMEGSKRRAWKEKTKTELMSGVTREPVTKK